ncbi:MAG: CoA-transferase [Polyangiaceae bacterium]|nr:CoA-transferase [Polyangiaceae bacterium]
MASPMAPVPAVGARLAKATFEPDLVLTDGVNKVLAGVPAYGVTDPEQVVEGWMPFPLVFDVLWWGKRHVMMGASQIDQYGNQNISCVGDFKKPSFQLLGARGAPGNTINHTTSYWVAAHSKKVFVPKVDMVSGVGYDRVRDLPEGSKKFHEIRRVITNLGVFDFETPDNRMRLRSVHPGATVEEIIANTGFELVIPDNIEATRAPTDEERSLIAKLDPKGIAKREVAA